MRLQEKYYFFFAKEMRRNWYIQYIYALMENDTYLSSILLLNQTKVAQVFVTVAPSYAGSSTLKSHVMPLPENSLKISSAI